MQVAAARELALGQLREEQGQPRGRARRHCRDGKGKAKALAANTLVRARGGVGVVDEGELLYALHLEWSGAPCKTLVDPNEIELILKLKPVNATCESGDRFSIG